MFFAGQHRELTTWHIFNFPREIQMGDVYVREIFREQTRGILLPVERSSPPIAEAELLESLLKPRLSDARQRLCIIQGNPGAGKSTLLRNWTLQLLAPKEDQVLPVPILIPLRSVSRALCAAALDEFVPDILSDAVSSSFFDVPKELSRIPFDYAASLRSAQSPSWLTQTIKRKRPQAPEWLLLFDGLDELDQRFHQTFLRWVRELPEPFTTIISTRRSANASTLTLSRHYEICDFDEDQIASFLLQWFRQQPEIAQNLCGVIKTKPAIREVCKVPLLVTCLAADVELRGDSQLDPNLDEPHLYRRAAEILLVDWDAHKHGIKASRALISAAFKTLGKLAATTAFDSDVSHDDLSSLCREFARDSNNSTAETIVEALISNGRILTGSAEFGYSFSHKAFYDYFLSLSLSE